MAEYINIDKNVIVYDTAGRKREVTVRHILSMNRGEFEVDDVRPVVRGRWKYNPGDNIPYCSGCMMPQDSECHFCPSCGADMREES